MGILDLFRSNNNLSAAPSTAVTSTSKDGRLESDLYRPLSYKDCQNLYSFIPLAKRVVNLPVKIAINNLNIKWGNEDEYSDVEELNYIDINYIKSLCIDYVTKVRLYGYSVLLPIVGPEDEVNKPLIKSEIYDKEIRYNILDPLNLSIDIDNNPASYNFKRITRIRINTGPEIYKNRALALNNRLNNLYLQYNNASFNYVGLSELQTCYCLINVIASAVSSMERQLLHSSIMVLEQDGNATNINTQAVTNQSELLSQVKQDSVVILKNGLKLNQFQLQNFDTITNSIDSISKLISMTTDIPSTLFTDESLGNGFSEGSSDGQLLESYLTDIRNSLIIPTMKFLLAYEVFNKVKDYKLATQIVDSIQIEFGSMFLDNEIIKESDNLSNEIVEEAVTTESTEVVESDEVKSEPEEEVTIEEEK